MLWIVWIMEPHVAVVYFYVCGLCQLWLFILRGMVDNAENNTFIIFSTPPSGTPPTLTTIILKTILHALPQNDGFSDITSIQGYSSTAFVSFIQHQPSCTHQHIHRQCPPSPAASSRMDQAHAGRPRTNQPQPGLRLQGDDSCRVGCALFLQSGFGRVWCMQQHRHKGAPLYADMVPWVSQVGERERVFGLPCVYPAHVSGPRLCHSRGAHEEAVEGHGGRIVGGESGIVHVSVERR